MTSLCVITPHRPRSRPSLQPSPSVGDAVSERHRSSTLHSPKGHSRPALASALGISLRNPGGASADDSLLSPRLLAMLGLRKKGDEAGGAGQGQAAGRLYGLPVDA